MSVNNILPKNIIYTGVAGTGKTYQLQQLAKQYTEILPAASDEDLLKNLVEPLSWREVICLVFLDERQKGRTLLKNAQINQHSFFRAKSDLRDNNSLTETIGGTLQRFAKIDSKTVNYSKRASQAFFDKDALSNWFLLEESLPLLIELQLKLDDYHTALSHNFQPTFLQPKIERFSLVSFHQAYGYEEFIEGIRPKINNHGQMTYSVEKGAFLKLCDQAQKDPTHRYAMLIDEINRANVSRVFGELMSLIEPSKRAGQSDAMSVNLAYSHQAFSVPSNVDIYATMNTQDHSLTPLDMAFRRRFRFVDCLPQPQLLGQIIVENEKIDLAQLLITLNDKIRQILGKDSELGHSFLMNSTTLEDLAGAFGQAIIPQVAQACQNNGQLLQAIFGQNLITVANQIQNPPYIMQNQGFSLNLIALMQVQTYRKLYE